MSEKIQSFAFILILTVVGVMFGALLAGAFIAVTGSNFNLLQEDPRLWAFGSSLGGVYAYKMAVDRGVV